MKSFLISFLILTFLSFSKFFAQSKSEQLSSIQKYKKLKVKNVRLFEYDYTIEGESAKNGYLREENDYDKQGRKTESRLYDGDKIWYTTKYIYDENNIEIRYYWENITGNKFKVVHHYDGRGFRIKSEQYDEASLVNWITDYFYNSLGKLEKEIHHFSGEYFYEYKYDSKGNLKEKISSPWGGRNKEKTIYAYDSNNLISESKTIDVVGDTLKTTIYKYLFYNN